MFYAISDPRQLFGTRMVEDRGGAHRAHAVIAPMYAGMELKASIRTDPAHALSALLPGLGPLLTVGPELLKKQERKSP